MSLISIYKIKLQRGDRMSTIVAISTSPGIGGIGIIRMSGENCFEILNKIFIPKIIQR